MQNQQSVVRPTTVRRIAIAATTVLVFLASSLQAQMRIDIARQSLTQLDQGMDGRSISIYGVTLGTSWGEARNILDRANVPYIFQKGTSPVVYVPPQQSTYYFVLNPSSYDVIEMGIIGVADLPLDNQYLFDAQRWRLTTARTQFFGNEGEFILYEEGESYNFPFQGFVLKYLSPGSFRFVIVAPTNKPLTTSYGQQTRIERPMPSLPQPTPPPLPTTPEPGMHASADAGLQPWLDAFQEAKGHFEAKEYSRALGLFKKISDQSPDQLLRVRSLYWMGECSYGMKQYSTAIKHFERVLRETDIATLRDPALKMIERAKASKGGKKSKRR